MFLLTASSAGVGVYTAGLMVQGRLLEMEGPLGGGRVTRAKAKQQGGLKYSQVIQHHKTW